MNEDIEVAALTTGNSFGSTFQDALDYYNRAIFRGLLIPQLLLETGSGGGLSNPGQVHWEVFKLMIQAFAKEIVVPFEEQVIGRMIRYNFHDTRPGSFQVEPFDASVTATMATIYEKLIMTGIIDPSDRADLDRVRERFGLPEREKKPVLTAEDYKLMITAQANKVANDKTKAEAAMIKAEGARTQNEAVAEKHGLEQDKHDHTKEYDTRDLDQYDEEIKIKRKELEFKKEDLKHKQEVDKEKLRLDHKTKMETARMQHEQNMLAIKKGYVAQPAPTAPTASKAPKVSNKTSSKPKGK
jgi:hypothetical protein